MRSKEGHNATPSAAIIDSTASGEHLLEQSMQVDKDFTVVNLASRQTKKHKDRTLIETVLYNFMLH